MTQKVWNSYTYLSQKEHAIIKKPNMFISLSIYLDKLVLITHAFLQSKRIAYPGGRLSPTSCKHYFFVNPDDFFLLFSKLHYPNTIIIAPVS